ncbi:polynucleotide adenylyltransferase PcnB [Allopusillimonas soli]|uniref:Poly(A) polymerase I n=1 Tax=Allopusillimonas soli TaxID=659016 RepID=A0A853FJG3_9BURK|nr:polynucleotide adenylyltransferase PcnB [Allopusillimonas soli]NYT38531.1 polynucleotide adenylyltransferase PcnB [Allopusillimonas soli]TEA71750.1 polynucleotide adenylyltransferase PcnB [Allopusillimonas soli]
MLKQTIKSFVERLFMSAPRGPERLPREKHGIDRRKVSRHAIKVCEVLKKEGYEAYIVGGAVRDLIVGLAPKDFDVATNATPEQVRPLFRRARIIGRRFQLVHVVFGQEIIETATFRATADGDEYTDEHGRILRDNLFGTQQDDAARRDFTLNALYYDPLSEEVIDYHQGVADLKKRVVRMIGEPEARYREDPVRMLRAVRFAAKLDGTIDPASAEPIARMASLIEHVPASRLFDETLKLLTCGHAMDCLRQLRAMGLHRSLLPLVDQIFAEEGGEAFIELAFERTDARVRAGKTVSPSFLFAALLWKLVNKRWQALCAEGEHKAQALVQAADMVMEAQTRKLAIQRRFQSDMREIWFMQPRFENASARSIWRMLEQPRFRAAVDFLQLRAEAREVDSVQAQWWMDLADADDATRAIMLEAYQAQQRSRPAGARRRRGRGRRSGGANSQQGAVERGRTASE